MTIHKATDVISAARACGIDAVKMTGEALREAYTKQKAGDLYSDQFDMRLEDALKREGY
jgi:hypothetical protein